MTLDLEVRKQVPSVPQALKALDLMERELAAAETYAQIRRIIKEASALKVLLNHVHEVKAKCEDTILVASIRIGQELEKIPKATGGDQKSKSAKRRKSNGGREATGIEHTSRSRLKKLADKGVEAVKEAAEKLRSDGKDATPRAVATLLTQGDKKEKRDSRERELGEKLLAMPGKKFGVIYADPPWRFEPYSRVSGMDRAPENHYPTMDLEGIKAIEVPAADDCVLFLWATIPMLPQAFEVMQAWGFSYKSHFVWVKDRIGTGYWVRGQHELLLIGTKGNVPAPAPGEQYSSVYQGKVGEHSAKPFAFREMIEEMFPTLPSIELFARGEKYAGWDHWGNEAA